ncbi:MAG TPA: DUF4375 domain-containing protein [Gemmata sp.]|jgi:hypothetical protein|nr:DUF4375 domain-containing protein [Gemmata sp.]
MKEFARDLVEHPDYHAAVSEEHERFVQALDAARAATPRSPTEFPRLIDDLLSHDKRRVNVAEIHLEKVAAAAEELLLAALDDPRATWTRDDDIESASAERVVRLLARIPSRALGDRIGHLADHPDWRVRHLAANARAALGRADDLPFVLGKLAEQCNYTQEGVELSIKQGWAEPAFITGLREWAERTALNDSLPFSLWAVSFYAERGGQAAVEALRSPRVLSVSNNRTVHVALEQLNRRGVRVEPEVVRPLLDKALASPETWPWNCVFGPALRALAASEPDAAARLAEEHLDRPESPHHRDATEFLREAAGLPEPYAVEPPAGMDLTDDERGLVTALSDCVIVYGEVCNGGLSQYFFNSSGSEWPRHVAALRAIGFEQGAAAVEEASRLIHADGASLDRDDRIAQYAALPDRREKRLDELSRLFWSYAPRVRFMLQHKALFARIREARLEAGFDKDGE